MIGLVAHEPALILYSAGLLNRWGFNDGDLPDGVADYLDAHGIDYPQNWREVLCELVTEHLLPAVRAHHELVVITMSTHHNPIRASLLDGENVEQWWTELTGAPAITPVLVKVSYDLVAAACARRATTVGTR